MNSTTFSRLGVALCGNKSCRNPIGRCGILKLKIGDRPIYPLKCRSVKIRENLREKNENPIVMKSQWKQIPFQIRNFFEDEEKKADDEIFYDASDN